MTPADEAREAVLLALVHLSQSREFDAERRDASWELALSIGARKTFTIGKDVA